MELQENPFLPQHRKGWFAFYTVASVIYRWVVVFSIMMFLMKVLEPYGLQALGRIVAVAGLTGMIVKPCWDIIKFFRTPGRASRMKRKNMAISLAVATGLVAGIVWLPLPYHVSCAVEIQPQDSQQVYALVPGRLVGWYKQPGDRVRAGEAIAQLDNVAERLQLAQYEGELAEAHVRVEVIKERTRIEDARAQLEIEQEKVRSRAALVNEIRDRIAQLTVVAKGDGVIFPPPPKPVPQQVSEEEQLPTWSDSPFDPKNQEAYFAESDLLCLIGDPAAWEAILVIDQHDIDLVHEGHEVEIMLESARLSTFSGKIVKISEMDMKEASENIALQSGGRLDTEMTASGRFKPISTSYQARVPLENVDLPMRIGYRGQARVNVGWKSLGWRVYRFLARTFRLEL